MGARVPTSSQDAHRNTDPFRGSCRNRSQGIWIHKVGREQILCPSVPTRQLSHTLGSLVRDTSEPWSLSLPGGQQKQDGVRTPEREDDRR